MKCNSNYQCSRAFEEAMTSVDPLGEHLHYAVLTMHVFWPLFFPFIVSSQWCLFGEITFALNWEPLIKSFLKEIGTKRTLPPPGSFLPLSSPSGRPSRYWYYNESKCWGVFLFLIVCVNEREWVVIYRLRGGMEACQCAMSVIRVPLHLSPWIKQS